MSVQTSYTKKGPGRKHQQCLLRYVPDADVYVKRPPRQRLRPAIGRFNYQGQVVMSYAEHDRKTLAGIHYVPSPIAGSVGE